LGHGNWFRGCHGRGRGYWTGGGCRSWRRCDRLGSGRGNDLGLGRFDDRRRLDALFVRLDDVRLRRGCGGTLFLHVRFKSGLGRQRTFGRIDGRRRFATLFLRLATAHDDGGTTLHHGATQGLGRGRRLLLLIEMTLDPLLFFGSQGAHVVLHIWYAQGLQQGNECLVFHT
jgi:hypothetical protein